MPSWVRALVIAGGLAAVASVDHAQELPAPIQLADRGPLFFAVPAGGKERVDVRNTAVLRQRLALDLHQATIPQALDVITAQTSVRFTYRADDIPAGLRVTLQATSITLAAAMTEVLLDAGLDVQLTSTGHLALVRRDAAGALPLMPMMHGQPGTATVTGRVIDATLKTPLLAASVLIDGTALGVSVNGDGRYTLLDVVPGTYHVTARRVGYLPLTKDITLSANQTATLDFALAAAPTKLDEVVTTAVGQQRRYEVGNEISTINADSIAPTAPITSLTDLISARAPGVTVLEQSGLTGAGEAIRIQGLSSLVLQDDPILIVDGVRQDNSAGSNSAAIFAYGIPHSSPSRLNDIDFNDIETIDILKGPSASTEYGTDAGSGVIVITTKHGTAGSPQWKASAEQTESDIPVSFPNMYYSWGHTTDGKNTPENCLINEPFGGQYAADGPPDNMGSTAGTCVVDSVTRWSPLNHAATTMFGTGDRAKYDLSVSGGSDAVRYFVTAGLSNETGLTHMPSVFKYWADTADLGLPSSAEGPNVEQQRSVRANTAIRLGSNVDLSASAAYLSTSQRIPDDALYSSAYSGPALSSPLDYYGYDNYEAYNTPLGYLSAIGFQNTDRVTGGLTANWRPTGWLVGHATVGLDHGSQMNENINYPLNNPAYQQGDTFLGIQNLTNDIYTVDLRGAATASLSRRIRAVTSIGLQLTDNRLAGQTGTVTGITPTNLTLNGATGQTVTQQANRQTTLGGYGEEQLSFADRLFVTGALRIDAGSGFGYAVNSATYPKASVSWLAVDRPSTTVRLRAAFGESGIQPENGAALQLYTATTGYSASGAIPVGMLDWPGNPNLKPERSEEFEGGVDIGGWGNRVSLELTGYMKTTNDTLVNNQLGFDLGGYTYQANIGTVSNRGIEATATVGVIQTRSTNWTVALNASFNDNKLLSFAPGVSEQTYSYIGAWRQTPGYPLYGLWFQKESCHDTNHSGFFEYNECSLDTAWTYAGPSMPTQEVSLSTHLALWRGTIAIGGLVDFRGGYELFNALGEEEDRNIGSSQGDNDPTAALWLQERAIGSAISPNGWTTHLAESGDFVRIREVSLTYALSQRFARALRVQSASLTAAVRNLALWTRYTGADPEVNGYAYDGVNSQFQPNTNSYIENNDIRIDYGAVPLARYWVLRLNIGV